MNKETLLNISIVGSDKGGVEMGCEVSDDVRMLTTAMVGAMNIPSFAAAANTAVLLTAAKAGKLDELMELIRKNKDRLVKEAKEHIVNDYVDFRIGGGKKATLS